MTITPNPTDDTRSLAQYRIDGHAGSVTTEECTANPRSRAKGEHGGFDVVTAKAYEYDVGSMRRCTDHRWK